MSAVRDEMLSASAFLTEIWEKALTLGAVGALMLHYARGIVRAYRAARWRREGFFLAVALFRGEVLVLADRLFYEVQSEPIKSTRAKRP